MADSEHVDLLLKGGVKKWNPWQLAQWERGRWRRVTPDFVRADFSLRSLAGTDFTGLYGQPMRVQRVLDGLQ